MASVLPYLKLILHFLRALFRSKHEQVILELALRQQLAVYHRTRPRPRLRPIDRAFWVAMRRWSSRWAETLVVVKPETVIRWHRAGFRLCWRRISRPGPGRPRIPTEVRDLIRRMAEENGWGARRIHAELEKLDIRVGLVTVSRYRPKRPSDPRQRQSWRTFLRNHRDRIGAMDFMVVPTVRFELLYVWFLIEHGSRRIVHFNVTKNPTSAWVIQQLRESFPDESGSGLFSMIEYRSGGAGAYDAHFRSNVSGFCNYGGQTCSADTDCSGADSCSYRSGVKNQGILVWRAKLNQPSATLLVRGVRNLFKEHHSDEPFWETGAGPYVRFGESYIRINVKRVVPALDFAHIELNN